MNKRSQLICAWCGPIFMALFTIGFWGFARLVPPPSPNDTPAQIAHVFTTHVTRLRLGLVISMISAGLVVPWCCAMAVQMKRIEGRWSPMTYVQLTAGTMASILFAIPLFMMEAAAYRPGRNPELIQLATDLAFLPFIGAVFLALVQNGALGLCILFDRSETPVFPRWAGYFNLWVMVTFLAGGLDVFFKDGPFAWNGVFAFWLPLTVLGAWVLIMTWLTIAAIQDQEARASNDSALSPA